MSKEAKIVCQTQRYLIEDLGLDLKKGEHVFVDEQKARASKDLNLAVRQGALSLQWVQRVKNRKPAPQFTPPYVRRMGQTVIRTPVGGTVEPTVPATDLIKLQKHMDDSLKRIEQVFSNQMTELSIQLMQLSAQLADMPRTVAVSGQAKPTNRLDKVPMFIPKDLTSSESEAHISVISSSAEDTLGDASAALKAMKKKRKKK